VTGNKHSSEEETVEDTAARLESDTIDTDAEAAAESKGRHAAVDEPDTDETDEPEAAAESAKPAKPTRQRDWSRTVAFVVLPLLAFLLAVGAGVLKFIDEGVRESKAARDESVQAAKDITIAMLSYKPDTVEQQLTAARDRLTGGFRDEYTNLTNNVVIPGAKEKQITAVANVPESASVSANPGRAVVLLFVNQTVTVGTGVPTDTASSVRVTLDKIGDHWMVSQFDPV
jgi:Mce-associated membrane protein